MAGQPRRRLPKGQVEAGEVASEPEKSRVDRWNDGETREMDQMLEVTVDQQCSGTERVG